jgi:hypothetical protein
VPFNARCATPHFQLRLSCSGCRLIRDQSGQSTYPGTVDCAKYFAIQSYEGLYDDVNRGGPMLKTLTLCAASVLILGAAVVYRDRKGSMPSISGHRETYRC